MDTENVSFLYEMKVEMDQKSVLNYENIEESSCEINGRQIQEDYFDTESIKQENIEIKTEIEGDEFSTPEFNDKQIQDNYIDIKPIKHEESNIRTESKGGQFCMESSLGESEKEHHPINDAAYLDNFIWTNTDNHGVNLEDPPVFKCRKCSYQTHSKQYIRRHVLCHLPKTLKCPLCPYKSNKLRCLNMHQLVHVPEEEVELYKCSKCPFTSKRKAGLHLHLLIHKTPDEVTWYQCPECPFKTKRKSELEYRHVFTHRTDQPIYKGPMYKCTFCSYESPIKCMLDRHLGRVHRPKDVPLFRCPEEGCLYKTHDQFYLQSHIKYLHKCQSMLKCSQCHFETKYVKSLKAHTLRHENTDKRFSCPLCSYKTTASYYLSRHAMVHQSASDIKWFDCTKCSFKSKRKSGLAKHELKHSTEMKETANWFYCYVCTYRTVYKYNLANHIRNIHRDAKGRICHL